MRISVIVPARNEERGIARTLAHTRQILDPAELLIVDAASSDRTAEIASQYGQVLTVATTRGAALNHAASTASGEVLLFLHADTLLPDEAREAIEAALRDPVVIGGAFRLQLDEPGWPARLNVAGANLRSTVLRSFFGDQAMFVRREAFERCGGFQPWNLMEDMEIVGRLRRLGRLRLLDAAVTTSARRHQQRGWLRTTLTIWAIVLLYRLGAPPEQLTRLYPPAR